MSTQKKLSDLGIPTQEYDSTPLSSVTVGEKLMVSDLVFKELGQYNGLIFELEKTTEVNGKKWDQVHCSATRVVKRFKEHEEVIRKELKNGPIEMTVISGRSGKGTWYDLE